MPDAMTPISEQEFLAIASAENCRAILDERMQAISPIYRSYPSPAQEFLRRRTFPPWRTNHDASEYIDAYQMPRGEACSISYFELSEKPHLFASISFDPQRDYLCTATVIVFHCQSCGVWLVKDGNHRLLQCALRKLNPELQIYEVSSENWSGSRFDMKNFCECISNNVQQVTCEDARA